MMKVGADKRDLSILRVIPALLLAVLFGLAGWAGWKVLDLLEKENQP